MNYFLTDGPINFLCGQKNTDWCQIAFRRSQQKQFHFWQDAKINMHFSIFNADIFLVKDTWDNQIKNIRETNINLGKAITSFKDIEENI